MVPTFTPSTKSGIVEPSSGMKISVPTFVMRRSTVVADVIVAAVPAEQTGVASGMNANIRTIGGSIGSAMMASIVTARLQPSGLPQESGYVVGFTVLAGGLVLAAVAGLGIPLGRRPVTAREAPHAELAMVAGGTVVGYDSE